MLEKLTKLASNSSAREQITFLPGVVDSDAILVYRKHDVLVLPSNREVWGMVTAEALVLGLQVIASDAVGASETFKQFSTFEVFQSGSADDLANKMKSSRKRRQLSNQEFARLIDLNSSEHFASLFSIEIDAFLSGAMTSGKVSKR
jgi:glycosyltransferase involved in cell wall biosynthesis